MFKLLNASVVGLLILLFWLVLVQWDCVGCGNNLKTCGDTLTHRHFSNLQFSLVDQKGVHEASAHLWVERLIQMFEQLQVAFLNETVYVMELLPVCDPSKDPWEQVVHLAHTKKLRCLHQERKPNTWVLHVLLYLHGWRHHQLQAPWCLVHLRRELWIIIFIPAAIDHGADDVRDGKDDWLSSFNCFPCNEINK